MLARTARSQARTAWVSRTLWSPRHLVGALRLPLHWALRRDGSAPPPLALAWYLTHACPETCDFCNVTQALTVEQPPMALAQALAVVDAQVPRIPIVALGGGEPLVYSGVFELMRRVQQRGGRVFLVTSGTTLGPARARRLAALAPTVVMVSLLGDEATHDQRMGRAGSWQRAIGAVDALARARDPRRTRLLLNCAIGPDDAPSIPAVIDAGRRLGVDAVRFTWLSFLAPSERQQAQRDTLYHQVSDDALAGWDSGPLLATAARAEAEHPGFVELLPRLSPAERTGWFEAGGGVQRRCLSLWHTLFLRPDGQVVPCGHLQDEPVGSLLDGDLPGVWNGGAMRASRLAQGTDGFDICRRCCKV